jgi:hypothetical protein
MIHDTGAATVVPTHTVRRTIKRKRHNIKSVSMLLIYTAQEMFLLLLCTQYCYYYYYNASLRHIVL